METFIEQQGFYDYINHVITGAIFLLCVELILLPFKTLSAIQSIYYVLDNIFDSENLNAFLWNVCLVVLLLVICFLLGTLFQELYSLIYHKKGGERSADDSKETLARLISRLFFKTDKTAWADRIFEETGPINNDLKRQVYIGYAKKLATEKELFPDNQIDLNRSFASYFFGYCVYYIQVRNQNQKTEKLRDIEGLSMSLSLVFLFLTIISVLALIPVIKTSSVKYIIYTVICSVGYALLSIIFDYHAEKALKNRVRMTLAVYEVQRDKESEATESDD